jgi:hypothetical protein
MNFLVNSSSAMVKKVFSLENVNVVYVTSAEDLQPLCRRSAALGKKHTCELANVRANAQNN